MIRQKPITEVPFSVRIAFLGENPVRVPVQIREIPIGFSDRFGQGDKRRRAVRQQQAVDLLAAADKNGIRIALRKNGAKLVKIVTDNGPFDPKGRIARQNDVLPIRQRLLIRKACLSSR